jgi:hypothetical protein
LQREEDVMGVFHRLLERLRRQLLRSDELVRADLIFVLAGHRNRKIYGARLFHEGWAPHILMSTGDPPYIARVLEKELAGTNLLDSGLARQIHNTSLLPSVSKGMFFAGLNREAWIVEPIPVGWFGTLSEIEALAQWLRSHPSISLALIVSSSLHMRRLRICCQQLLPRGFRFRLIAVPADEINLAMQGKLPEKQGTRRILSEWSKILIYSVILFFPRRGRRAALPAA